MPILMTSMPKQKKLWKKELSTNQMGLKVLWRVVDAVKVVKRREENQRKENHVEEVDVEEVDVEEDKLLT